MSDICSIMKKMIDRSNYHSVVEYKETVNQNKLRTWNDDILARTDLSIKDMIDRNNEQVNHLKKCKNKGCKELLKTWNSNPHTKAEIKKKREDLLRPDQNQELSIECLTVEKEGISNG